MRAAGSLWRMQSTIVGPFMPGVSVSVSTGLMVSWCRMKEGVRRYVEVPRFMSRAYRRAVYPLEPIEQKRLR